MGESASASKLDSSPPKKKVSGMDARNSLLYMVKGRVVVAVLPILMRREDKYKEEVES